MEITADLFQPQMFLDDTWIASASSVTRRWHRPRKYPEPVLRSEHPWEHGCPVMYGTVLFRQDLFQMWYCVWTRDHEPRVCYAQSRDGVVWEKPSLGICEFEGSKENNIVIESAYPAGLIDDITVIDDPDDAAWPLKALFWDAHPHRNDIPRLIYAARSKDGIHWERSPEGVLGTWGDRFNAVSTRLNGKYVVFGRGPADAGLDCWASPPDEAWQRTVWRTESDDLVHWSAPSLVLAADAEDEPAMQIYSLVAFPYGNLLLGGIERMHMSPDKLDTELAWSHDGGLHWQRPRSRPSFIPWGPDRSWDDSWLNLPTNAPIQRDNRLWFYYSGRSGCHHSRYPMNYGGIGLATLRIDGFASLQAAERTGHILTPPLAWPDADLYLNIDTRRDIEAHPAFESGELAVEVRDEANRPLPGFAWADCIPMIRNTVYGPQSSRPVHWKPERPLRQLAGQRIRLAFRLRDCHLYSFRAVAGSFPQDREPFPG